MNDKIGYYKKNSKNDNDIFQILYNSSFFIIVLLYEFKFNILYVIELENKNIKYVFKIFGYGIIFVKFENIKIY